MKDFSSKLVTFITHVFNSGSKCKWTLNLDLDCESTLSLHSGQISTIYCANMLGFYKAFMAAHSIIQQVLYAFYIVAESLGKTTANNS